MYFYEADSMGARCSRKNSGRLLERERESAAQRERENVLETLNKKITKNDVLTPFIYTICILKYIVY